METGWFWWGSGAQAWQLEREPRGSSREGLAPMPMVGVGGWGWGANPALRSINYGHQALSLPPLAPDPSPEGFS